MGRGVGAFLAFLRAVLAFIRFGQADNGLDRFLERAFQAIGLRRDDAAVAFDAFDHPRVDVLVGFDPDHGNIGVECRAHHFRRAAPALFRLAVPDGDQHVDLAQ